MASGSSWYSEKLKDPRWQRKRLEVFERDKWTCQGCQSKDITLNVHHWYYTRGHDPWDYPMDCFSTLCEKCHGDEGKRREGYERMLIRVLREKRFTVNHLCELAFGILVAGDHARVMFKAGVTVESAQEWTDISSRYEQVRYAPGSREKYAAHFATLGQLMSD
jgi:hypothetical protein